MKATAMRSVSLLQSKTEIVCEFRPDVRLIAATHDTQPPVHFFRTLNSRSPSPGIAAAVARDGIMTGYSIMAGILDSVLFPRAEGAAIAVGTSPVACGAR